MPLKILILHQHYWPETAATAQILSDLCEDLAADGHDVTVICAQPSYRAADTSTELPVSEVHRNVKIERVWSYRPKVRSIPRRLVQYGSYFASSLVGCLSRERPDVCFVMSTPPLLLGISGTILRKLRGVPFVYSVQDLYPDIAYDLGTLRKGSPVGVLAKLVSDYCYGSAHTIVTLSPGMAAKIRAKGMPKECVRVIPNWADTNSISSEARDNIFAREHGLVGQFVVQYSGNLGLSQGLEHVIAAAALLRDTPIKFVFVGEGNAKPGLCDAVRSQGLDNVCFLPPQPRENLSQLLGACDVGLVSMKKGVGDDLVPSKLYGIMAAGRPVLATVEASSEVARVLREYACGWVVEPEDPAALAAAIHEAWRATEEERLAKGERGRVACASNFSRKVCTRQYEVALSRAVTGRDGGSTVAERGPWAEVTLQADGP